MDKSVGIFQNRNSWSSSHFDSGKNFTYTIEEMIPLSNVISNSLQETE
jgi:hypothetical protein